MLRKNHGMVNVSHPKICRMASHATHHYVILECLGICDFGHRLVTKIGLSTIRPINHVSTPSKAGSPTRLQTVSVLSQTRAAFPLQNKTTEISASNPDNLFVDTVQVEELTPFRTAESSNGALPTPSCFSERFPFLPSDVAQKTRTLQTQHNTSAATRTNYGLLRRRRSHFGAAMTLV